MTDAIEALIEGWDGLGVFASRHRETDSWIFVAIHDATLGRPTGGCRMMTYDSPASGLRDAMRLAEGMTYKWAAMGFGFGGAKSVLAVPGPVFGDARRSLFARYAKVLDGLGGGCGVGEDLGTTPEDMRYLATLTSHVAGSTLADGHPIDPGPFTAAGVHAGIAAALAHLDRPGAIRGATVLVEGAGNVGGPLTALLARSGAKVLVADANPERARAVANANGGGVVAPADVPDTPCDVYAPCAVGATVSARTAPRLRCKVVAGSANNQLETDDDAGRLRRRGILYAPDYVVNGGGAMAFGLMEQGIRDPARVTREVVRRIGESLAAIFREADQEGFSPVDAAHRVARRALGRSQTQPEHRP